MQVYHYTHKFKWAAMQRGLYDHPVDADHPPLGLMTSTKGAHMYHPARSEIQCKKEFVRAFWAFETPLPQKWVERKAVDKGLRELFGHIANGEREKLTLLELTLPDNTDLWAADWYEHRSGYHDMYDASMRLYTGPQDTKNMKLPELVCFDDVPLESLREIPLPDIPSFFIR